MPPSSLHPWHIILLSAVCFPFASHLQMLPTLPGGACERRGVSACAPTCIHMTAQLSMETQLRGSFSIRNHTPSVVLFCVFFPRKRANNPSKAKALVHIWPVPRKGWWTLKSWSYIYRGGKKQIYSSKNNEDTTTKLAVSLILLGMCLNKMDIFVSLYKLLTIFLPMSK